MLQSYITDEEISFCKLLKAYLNNRVSYEYLNTAKENFINKLKNNQIYTYQDENKKEVTEKHYYEKDITEIEIKLNNAMANAKKIKENEQDFKF